MSITKLCPAVAIFTGLVVSALAVSAKGVGSFTDPIGKSVTPYAGICGIGGDSITEGVLIGLNKDLLKIRGIFTLKAENPASGKLRSAAWSA